MPERSLRRLTDRAPLPEGALVVTIGVVVAGVAAYGFLLLAGRYLEGGLYSDLSVLWVLGFIAGPGVFMPLEQEVSRAIAARRARGLGAKPVLQRAVILGAAMLAILSLAATAFLSPISHRLFDGHTALFASLLISLASLYVGYLARGYLSGNRRFGAYSVLVAGEGILRLLPAVVLAGFGVSTVGWYGLAFGVAPLISAPLVLSRNRRLVQPGPEAPWNELSSALGYLVAAALLSQLLLNLAPVAVKLLSSPSQKALAGHFLSGLIIARVPVVLFQAVLAALLPKLAALAASNEIAEFRSTMARLLGAVAVLGAGAIVGAIVAGQLALHILFGPEFNLSRADFGYMSAASIVLIVALTFGQALIAVRAYRQNTAGWVAGVAGFAAAAAVIRPLLLRVELGFLAGALVAALVLGLLLSRRLAKGAA